MGNSEKKSVMVNFELYGENVDIVDGFDASTKGRRINGIISEYGEMKCAQSDLDHIESVSEKLSELLFSRYKVCIQIAYYEGKEVMCSTIHTESPSWALRPNHIFDWRCFKYESKELIKIGIEWDESFIR
jgi:hypothetical protein